MVTVQRLPQSKRWFREWQLKQARIQAHILVCFFGADHVAKAPAMDEGLGTRYCLEKVIGGVTGIEISGCASAGAGENPQTQNGSYPAQGTPDAASEIEDFAPH